MIVAYYSANTGRVNCVSLLDSGENPRRPNPGEGRIDIDQKILDAWQQQWRGGGDRDPIQEFISSKTGLVPTDDRYVIVQNGVVVDWIGNADPALGHLDGVPQGATVVQEAIADKGWTYDGQTFTKPAEVTTKGAALGP